MPRATFSIPDVDVNLTPAASAYPVSELSFPSPPMHPSGIYYYLTTTSPRSSRARLTSVPFIYRPAARDRSSSAAGRQVSAAALGPVSGDPWRLSWQAVVVGVLSAWRRGGGESWRVGRSGSRRRSVPSNVVGCEWDAGGPHEGDTANWIGSLSIVAQMLRPGFVCDLRDLSLFYLEHYNKCAGCCY